MEIEKRPAGDEATKTQVGLNSKQRWKNSLKKAVWFLLEKPPVSMM